MPIHQVGSIAEVRAIIKDAEPHEELEFYVRDDTPLNQARSIWKVVRHEHEGGGGFLANPDVLGGKDGAFRFVNQKLDELKRLANNSETKLAPLTQSTNRLQQVVEAGGPGLPASFEPQAFGGPSACMDTDEEVEEGYLEQHISQLRGLILEGYSPGSPAPDGYRSAELVNDRERLEQRALAELNSDINMLKRNLLLNLSNDLRQGIAGLEEKYLVQPTHLGCGSGEFVRFESLPMLPADRKGQTY
ncbi:unnamed protein product [Urochloa decumbens]|uniref:Uncharacterized protein n=1 Tax=Urochloa decumbens TaxID=240449 RepID=A0ABC8ZI88_9POAL